MAIEVACPDCGQAYHLREEYGGQTVRCRQCQAAFPVGGSRKQGSSPGGPLKRPSPGLAVAIGAGIVFGVMACCIGVPVLGLAVLGTFTKPHAPAAKRQASATKTQQTGGKEGEKDVEALLKDLDAPDAGVRAKALKTLARLKAPQALSVVARRLTDAKDRREAANTLIAYGPAAEEEAAKYLGEEDKAVRREVCRILKAVGTEKSKPALEAAAKDKDRDVAKEAQNALKEIDKRR